VVTPVPRQGEVWWAEAEDKRRPVLVVSRSEAVPVLTWIVVAPVTRTVRCIPTEVALGPDEGLPEECVASFDNLQPIRRSFLTERVGGLDADSGAAICGALEALADC
jgi:mRNA interferase MazF